MTDKEILQKINAYSEVVLKDIDPQKVQVSVQLEKLRPVMEEIAAETGMELAYVFIKYMDLATNASVQKETEFQKLINQE